MFLVRVFSFISLSEQEVRAICVDAGHPITSSAQHTFVTSSARPSQSSAYPRTACIQDPQCISQASTKPIMKGLWNSFFPRAPAKGSSYKNICRTTSHLHLHIFTSAHPLLIFTSTLTTVHLHLCSSSHPHITSTFTTAHLHLTSSPLALLNFLS